MGKIFFIRCVSQFFLLLLGASFALFGVGIFYEEPVFSLTHHHWASVFSLLLVCLFSISIYAMKSEKIEQEILEKEASKEQEKSILEANELRTDLEKFKREVMHVLREVMKTNAQFLLEKTIRKKNLCHDDAKKELIRDLRKEFQSIFWMLEILEEIKKSLKQDKSS